MKNCAAGQILLQILLEILLQEKQNMTKACCETKYAEGETYQTKYAAGQIFGLNPDG